jgi:hypothetical protein
MTATMDPKTYEAWRLCIIALAKLDETQQARLIAELLLCAFAWRDELHGWDYWTEVYNRLSTLKMADCIDEPQPPIIPMTITNTSEEN